MDVVLEWLFLCTIGKALGTDQTFPSRNLVMAVSEAC